jgi:putative transposase
VSVRQNFVLRALSGEVPVAELCREFGVSRKTGYKWLKRFKEKGVSGLVSRPRRPRGNRLAITADMATKIVALKQKHPRWGAKKIWVLLVREHQVDDVPSVSTINRVLHVSGLVKKKRRYRPTSPGLPQRPAVSVEAPNDLWTVDFKGWWRAGNGERCDPLTIRDAFSRYVLDLRLLRKTNTEAVRPVFERLFETYGVPKAIQSDNGPPFASRGLGGLSALSAWWVSLGIDVVRSRPGKPTDNGGHERMHADISVDIQADAAFSLALQQHACDAWRDEFNLIRPHEGLGMKTRANSTSRALGARAESSSEATLIPPPCFR